MFRSKFNVLLVLLATLTIVACGKRGDDDDDNTPADPPIVGTFQVNSTQISPFVEYQLPFDQHAVWARFETDRTYNILHQTPLGFRSISSGAYFATDTQVIIDSFVLNYSVDGDNLTLEHPDFVADLERSATVPTAFDWAGAVSFDQRQSVVATNESDLAFDGSYLWYSDAYGTNELIQYDFVTESVISTLPTTNSAIGIGFDGANLWTSSNGQSSIYELNMTTGANMVTSTTMGPWIYGIAWDGAHLWTYANNARTVYEYDPVGDTIVQTIDVSELPYGGLQGMTFVNGDLYIVSATAIYRVQTDPFQVLDTFLIDSLDMRYASGIVHDGAVFYVFGFNYADDMGEIARVGLSQ